MLNTDLIDISQVSLNLRYKTSAREGRSYKLRPAEVSELLIAVIARQ